MNQNDQSLMKIFSLVLRERAKAASEFRSISPEMVKFFSRKELIEIITQKFEGELPDELNLMEVENNELLKLIGDDYYLISYVTSKWSKEVESLPLAPERTFIAASLKAGSAKAEAKKNETKKEDNKKEDPKQGENKG